MMSIPKTLGIAALVAFSVSTQAQITFTSGGSLTAWNGTPSYASLGNGSLTGLSPQSDLTITGTYGILAETFTPSSTFTLGSISLLMSVNNVNNPYLINLYHLGPAGTVSVSSGAATYTPGTTLFSDNNVTIAAATGGQVQGTFSLPLVDQVTLTAGEQYALEIWTPAGNGASGIQWYRNATADSGGADVFVRE